MRRSFAPVQKPVPKSLFLSVNGRDIRYGCRVGARVIRCGVGQSQNCVLFCCKPRRKRLEHERRVEENTRRCVSPYFVSLMLFNRTDHSQGFLICFMIKNPLSSLRFTSLFFNKSESGLYQNCILKTGEGIEFILKAVLIGFICLTEIHK